MLDSGIRIFSESYERQNNKGVIRINTHIVTQINQMLLSIRVFEDSLEIAAKRDDGKISKEEEKTIRKIKKVSAKYKIQLEKIKNE